MNSSAGVFFQGFVLSLGLIVAIGAQNAFVLRQGLRREHVGAVVVFCALADAMLIAAGVLGIAEVLGHRPELAQALTWMGAAFLAWYGYKAFLRARQTQSLRASAQTPSLTLAAALMQVAAFTFLNPHVYLDTVMLMGSMGGRYPAALQYAFIAGASAASLVWFVALGYGAQRLAPWFGRPRAWQLLDLLIALTMWTLATTLVLHALAL